MISVASVRKSCEKVVANTPWQAFGVTMARQKHFIANAQLGYPNLPPINNEPCRLFEAGSKDREYVTAACDAALNTVVEIPVVINGKEHFTGDVYHQVVCHDHGHVLANVHRATPAMLKNAIEGTMIAKEQWHRMPFNDRAAIFLRAADILAQQRRHEVLAATMLGQGKTVVQAEVDAAAELIDFWRFGVKFADEIYGMQPPKHAPANWNSTQWRPLDGFVAAISPFNFTAIGGNLCSAPAIMGNGVLWKPADTASLSSWRVYQILREAGLPDGVIQWTPADGPTFGDTVIADSQMTGLHFTGSTATFQLLNRGIAEKIDQYVAYPRVVGETGGKDFHFLHSSADVEHAVASSLLGAFEFQGQKCSATSRAYVPESLWPTFRDMLVAQMKKIRMGPSNDYKSFMSAVIDKKSFDKIHGYIDRARKSPDCTILSGGGCDDSVGYFVEPTFIHTTNPNYESMREEIFGPVLSVYVYPDHKFEETLDICDKASPYGLTGSIFANDRYACAQATDRLRFAAGNFYINDKCTGSVVGQQPFGGSRASGTNDKSGSLLNMLRWSSARSVKENLLFRKQDEWSYPSVDMK